MIHKQTTNTFSEGLIMDLNPVTTPNNVLTNALNATYITYNGNEYALQNDMGNGRVETAYLPQGFIPLGTTSFGGIIYIVSYNPLIDKCQVGCFPSPERNIDSYNNDVSQNVTIQDSDFFDLSKSPIEVKNNVIIKKLSDLKLSPGDKYIVHGQNIINNSTILSGYKIDTQEDQVKVLDIRLATQDNNGNIIYIDSDLEYYTMNTKDSYYIQDSGKKSFSNDVDAERTSTASIYNIFNNNVSGNIYIVAKLETIDTFDVIYSLVSKGKGWSPVFNAASTAINNTSYSSYSIEEGGKTYDKDKDTLPIYKKDSGIKVFKFVPSMSFNSTQVTLPYLSKEITIDFSLVGDNTSELYLWRYYNSDTQLTLNWGLQNHYEPKSIDYIEFEFINLLDSSQTSYKKQIKDYTSYNGTFVRDFTYDSNILKDTLYHIKINIYVKDIGKIYSIDKLLYTNKIFNNKYLTDSNVKDFGTLSIQDELDLNLNTDVTYQNEITTNLVKPTTTTKSTEWLKGNPINTETLGYTWYKFNNKQKFNSSLKYSYQFTDNYNIFTLNRYIANGDISYTFNIPNSLPTISTPTTQIIGDLTSSELNGYIEKDSIFINMDQQTTNVTDILKNKIIEQKFDLEGSYGNPIWASMVQLGVTYTNLIAPLIYNDATLLDYNMTPTTNDDKSLCKIDTTKILCIGPNSAYNPDWWISYGELGFNTDTQKTTLLLKDNNGDFDLTNLKLGGQHYYDSIISDFANIYFNNSPIIPYCFLQTYDNSTYDMYNADGTIDTYVGYIECKHYDKNGNNTVTDLTYPLHYGVLIKNSAGYYIPIRLVSVGNSIDNFDTSTEPDNYPVYDNYPGGQNPKMTKSSINRKIYELLCQLYKVYSKVNYKDSNVYIYDKRSYYDSFNLEINQSVEIKLGTNLTTVRPFNQDLSTINFDVNNLNFNLETTVNTVDLKYTIPIQQKLLDYYTQDFSYQNYILRTNTGEFYIPKENSYTVGSLYFINKGEYGYENDLILVNKSNSDNFIANFRRLTQIMYQNGDHKCIFNSHNTAANLTKMNIQQVLTLNNGIINMETVDSTHKLRATGMLFYQSDYGNLIGNLDTN